MTSEKKNLVCYCFNHSVEDIHREIKETGTTTIPDDIKAKVKSGECFCETANPSGKCCLGDVARVVKEAKREHGKNASKTAESGKQLGAFSKWSGIGALFSAVIASTCRWLPLTLMTIGVSGAAISTTFEKYRPFFMVLTFGFLGAAFYFAYRPRRVVAGRDGEACSAVVSSGSGSVDSCCADGKSEFRTTGLKRTMLWVMTVFVLTFAFFPNYVGLLFGDGSSSSEMSGKQEIAVVNLDLQKIALKIDGMTCAGCAVSIDAALRAVKGVSDAEVRFDEGRATLLVTEGNAIPRKDILAVIAELGYTGSFINAEDRIQETSNREYNEE